MAITNARSLLSLLLFSVSVLSSPLSSSTSDMSHLFRRTNPCQNGQVPILYTKEYLAADCPPANAFASDGSCSINSATGCSSYCEVRQNFYYGTEVPFDLSFCHGPLTCTITSARARTYTYKLDTMFTAGIKGVLSGGVTGGYSDASAITDTRATSIKLDQGQCGYFTFLPILHDSCGSLTSGSAPAKGTTCLNPMTTGNFCSTQLYRSADGKTVLGDTVFVRVDCGTHQRLPDDQQDPAYNHPNVALPQSAFTTFSQQFPAN